jgi:hypothetical protein
MDVQTGCLSMLLALIIGIGALFVGVSSSGPVEVSEPVVVEVPAASPAP